MPKPIRTIEGISEYQMPNGLKVLLFPDKSQSTVTVNVTYLVGSRHEGLGEAGMAHLLEHMLFKGTPKYPDAWAILNEKGAKNNATTWYDRTNYFETLPASDENLKFALDFESDRMINSWIKQKDLDSEMTVVRNEFEMGENNPIHVLHDKILSSAYQWHNYGKSTIGNRSDIERVPTKKLKTFYKKYYQPDNAVLIIAGNFDKTLALEQTQNTFGKIPKPERELDATYTEEPAQDGARRVKLRRTGEVGAIGAAYHVPAGSHTDHPALSILSEVLSSEPGGFLYKKLVKSGEASELFGMVYNLAEPGTLLFFTKPVVLKNIFKVEKQMLTLLEKEHAEAITKEAVDRAKAHLLKRYKIATNNSQKMALNLSESIAQGGFELYFWYRDQLKDVSVEDVKRVAKQYLLESNRTAGVFIPSKKPRRAEVPSTPNVKEMLKDFKSSEELAEGEEFEASISNIEKRTTREKLTENIQLALLPKQTRGDSVKAKLIFRFGDEKSIQPHKYALQFIPHMLMRGTKNKSFQDIKDQLDKLQSSASFSESLGAMSVNIVSDKENIEAVIDLVSEVLKDPSFLQVEFDVVKKQFLTDLEEAESDPEQLGFNVLGRLSSPWPKDSIFYTSTFKETIAHVKKVTIDDLKKAHQSFYGADRLDVAVVGSFDVESLKAKVASHFSKWKTGLAYKRIVRPFLPAQSKLETVQTPGKQMSIVAMATNMKLQSQNPDFAAIRMANYILGEGMKSDLLERLRQKEGISYGTYSWVEASNFVPNASLTLYAMAANHNADKALEIMEEVYQNWLKKPVSSETLTERKKAFSSMVDNQLSNDDYIVSFLASGFELDRTFDYVEKLLERIQILKPEDITKAQAAYLVEQTVAKVKAGDIKG